MLISCEKCSTTYVLDDALIPPQGAPVQCTRCGHVFTAKVTSASEPAPPPRAANAAANSTMMFGSPAAPPPPSKNTTMMFGAGGVPVPPPAPPPPANKNQTMMFGTAASNAAAQAPQPPPPSSKQTMVFGSGAAAVPPPPAKNQTMMFGTAASNAAAQAQQNAPPPSAKQTMVFGTGAAVPPPAAPPPPSKNQTMMFGTPASNAATQVPPPPANPPGSSAKTTIMFGGNQPQPAPQAPPPSSKQTMVFGSVPGQPPQQPARPVSSPQRPTFGTPASNAVDDAPADETILEQPGQSSRTMLFGTPTADEPNAATPAKNQTMMFGRSPNIPKVTAGSVELAGMSADEGAPNERTVRVDNPSEDQEASAEPEAPARQDRTQRFAMTDLGGGSLATTPPEGRDPVQDRHNRTQLFAMSSSQEATAPVGESLDATLVPGAMRTDDLLASRAPTMDLSSTLPPDHPLPSLDSEPAGVSLLHDPANLTPMEAEAAPSENEGLVATTLANLGPVQGTRLPPLKLELPSEPMGSPQDFARPPAPVLSPQAAATEDAAAMRAARGGGAGRIVVIILAIVALALAGVLVYRLFGDQIMNAINPPPPAPPVG